MGTRIREEKKEICKLLMEGKLSFSQFKQKVSIYLEKNYLLEILTDLYSENFL